MKQQKLLSLIRQAIEEYHMLEDGDRVAVGVSGGKDSLTLLYEIRQLQRFYPKYFELSAIPYTSTSFPPSSASAVRQYFSADESSSSTGALSVY